MGSWLARPAKTGLTGLGGSSESDNAHQLWWVARLWVGGSRITALIAGVRVHTQYQSHRYLRTPISAVVALMRFAPALHDACSPPQYTVNAAQGDGGVSAVFPARLVRAWPSFPESER